MDIDLVYLWVDGSDPNWQAKKNAFTGKADETHQADCKGRYANNDELKYSLRSVEKYAPWIRKIFIVTDNQTPDWLDVANPKIEIIDHKDILPQESLPCFNPFVIESFLYKIPGLSERFLFANDDMFFNKPSNPDHFFLADGLPIIRLSNKPFRRLAWFWKEKIQRKPLLNYRRVIANASELVKQKYGTYYNGKPHHNIDAYLKSDCQRVVEEIFKKEFEAMRSSHLRTDDDIQRVIFSYVALAEKRGHRRYVTRKESFHGQIGRGDHYKTIEEQEPLFFCMNDTERSTDNHRENLTMWLNNYFPKKSPFEN